MASVLQVKNLTKLYRNGRGVSDVSFEINRGDVLGLLGPNGSGKTTTMKAICGLCHPNSGEVIINGHSVYDDYEKAMEKVGCLIEMPAFYEYMSAYSNLKNMARLYDNITTDSIERVLKIVRLDKYRNDKSSRFSLGMKQRLGLAMAFISEPEIVILDEPANGLDIEGMIEIREIITNMAQTYGTTFIISSHLANEIEKTCNKVAVLYDGEMLSFDLMEEALNPTLEDYFLSTVRNKRGSVII